MKAVIKAIEYYLPERVLSTADLAAEYPEWSVEKIESKTGIHERHIAAPGECSSDLAVAAAEKLFASGVCQASGIDYVLLCTQSPDYFLPTTACLVQDRLGIPTTAGAMDFNLGCSGYVAGLGLARGLIETGQASRVLLLTAETYSKFIHPRDKSVRTIFGDAAAATLVEGVEAAEALIGPFQYGTDGSGGRNLIVPTGGMRCHPSMETAVATEDESGNWRSRDNLFMDGGEIFNFTIRAVPKSIQDLLAKAQVTGGRRGPVRVSPGEQVHAGSPPEADEASRREVLPLHGSLREYGLLHDSDRARERVGGGTAAVRGSCAAGGFRRGIFVGIGDGPVGVGLLPFLVDRGIDARRSGVRNLDCDGLIGAQ